MHLATLRLTACLVLVVCFGPSHVDVGVCPSKAAADDWPGWRGPERTDLSSETGLLKEWPEGGPKRVWMYQNAGKGYSGPAIVEGRLYTLGTRGGQAALIALNADTGEEVWVTPFREALSNGWGSGPRSTPSVVDDRVYALSGQGCLVCAKTGDGSIVWKKEMVEFGGHVPNWGYSESPLIDGDRVITTPGGDDGTLLALNRHTGETIWQSFDIADRCHYSSVIRAEVDGVPQYIQLTKGSVFGVASQDGSLIWRSDWDGRTAVVPTPICHEGQVYVTSGYGVGCQLVTIADGKPKEVYKNKTMINHHGGVILLDGHIYGFSDGSGWTCQNLATGSLSGMKRKLLERDALPMLMGSSIA